MGEPSVEPSYLLQAVRRFLVSAGGAEEAAGKQTGSPPPEDNPDVMSYEEAGCLVWDAAALPDDAAFLLQHDVPAMLQPLLSVAASAQRWRALEIALGILGNLACHADARRQLLGQPGLAPLLLDTLLWVDDAAALAELCRCLAGLLAGGEREAAERWWPLLLREETVGRIVWMVEDTLNSLLLERALNLLNNMVTAAAALGGSSSVPEQPPDADSTHSAAAGATGEQLVQQLLSLELLPLLASVLNGWCTKLQAEHQHFGGGSAQQRKGRDRRGSTPPAAGGDEALAAAAAAEGAARSGSPAVQQPAADDLCVGPSKPGPAAVAAEVTEAAALEALALLEALAADGGHGEQAMAASGAVKQALLRTIAEGEHRGMQALSIALLAGLDGGGPLLIKQPAAVVAILARLAVAAEGQASGGSTTTAGGSGKQQEHLNEEVEAAWALCSALAHALHGLHAAQQGQAQQEADAKVEGIEGGGSGTVLAVLADQLDVLCHEWASTGPSLRRHQAYVLQHLAPLLLRQPSVTDEQQQALQDALERCQA